MEDQVTDTQTAEPTNDQVNSELLGIDAPQPTERATQSQPDQNQLNQMIQEAIRQAMNPVQAELGKFRKLQSEFDRQKNQQAAYQPPKAWADLDEPTRRTTQDIIEAAWKEKFGKEWDSIQGELSEFRSTKQQQSVMNDVQRIAGKDFGELDDIMGNIYRDAKKAADSGDPDAADFIQELFETKSARYRLVEMARAQKRGSLESQSQQAQTTQAQARNRASTAVTRSNTNTQPAGDLKSIQNIRDPKKRLEALQPLMDASQG
jgi:hypothetical protein